MRRLLLSVILALAPLPAMAAGSTVYALPSSPAIVGSQLVYCPVGVASNYKCTFTQVQTFVLSGLGALPACTPGSSVAPVPTGQPFQCAGVILIAQ